jgi:hypothetical protein
MSPAKNLIRQREFASKALDYNVSGIEFNAGFHAAVRLASKAAAKPCAQAKPLAQAHWKL